MKIKTKIPVTYNNGFSNQETGIVTGEIMICMQDYLSKNYNFNFQYLNENGMVINTMSSNFILTKDEVNELYNSIKSSIPKNLEHFETIELIYNIGFKVKMAETFGITINDIETIN